MDISKLSATERAALAAALRKAAKEDKAAGLATLHNRKCVKCGADFTTTPTRGRPPVSCPPCREAALTGALASLRAKSPAPVVVAPPAVEADALAALAEGDAAPVESEPQGQPTE